MTGIHIPAEWAPRRAIWTAWPSDAALWRENLAPARAEVAGMVSALALAGDAVKVLASGADAAASARAALAGKAEVIEEPFGDIWLRDTGPIFAKRGDEDVALCFRFNGWGGKYVLDHDDRVAEAIAARSGARIVRHDFVLEGGAIEMDGEGTLLTTRQCLLNKNRNPTWSEGDAEKALRDALGVEQILWLDEGLANDHTDGHIDNLARFIAPGVVLCQHPVADDPNTEVLEKIARDLAAMRDAKGRKLEVLRIPSPGRVLNEDGEVMPASHMNFVVAVTDKGRSVFVPTYDGARDELLAALFEAAQRLPLSPSNGGIDAVLVMQLASRAILSGGGAFHCITQQAPL
ncbi:MAG: agmatine deiminase [Alphaproteobacteria bacterium]|nr:agmatine deiminase [Alphaproteobacteria bacterium]